MKKVLLFLMPLFIVLGISFAYHNRETDMHKWFLDLFNNFSNPFEAFDNVVSLFNNTKDSVLNVGSSSGVLDFLQNIWFVIRDFGILLFGFFIGIFNFMYKLLVNIITIFRFIF